MHHFLFYVFLKVNTERVFSPFVLFEVYLFMATFCRFLRFLLLAGNYRQHFALSKSRLHKEILTSRKSSTRDDEKEHER